MSVRWRIPLLALLPVALAGAQGERVSRPIESARQFVRTGHYLDDPKIFGGLPAKLGDDPWQVALVLPGPDDAPRVLFCGGSVVGPRTIVTAAHCVDGGTPPSALQVVVGASDLVRHGRRHGVSRIWLHPAYVASRHASDVAVIELATAVAPSGVAITLPRTGGNGPDVPGLAARVTGWGATSEGGGSVRHLRYVDGLKLLSNDACNDPAVYDGRIGPTMVCAVNGRTGMDSCQGDSGGPLTAMIGGVRTLIGVVSWGEGCGRPDRFGVYARLTALPWVHGCVADRRACVPSN